LGEGYPDNEYEPEVKSIMLRLNTYMSDCDIYDLVREDFRSSFYQGVTDGCKGKYRQMAGNIHEWMKIVRTMP
jgi:hypothetical protein